MGDNELSPECLDGVQRVLKDNGVCIPSTYTPLIAPISSSVLYSRAKQYGEDKYLQTPYVVKFQNVFSIAEPIPIWEFKHPVPEGEIYPQGHPDFNSHNTRFSVARFDISQSSIMHGFAAYFECTLYKDITLSINPSTHSKDMTSWFPMYFPAISPIYLPAGGTLEISIWRLTDQRKVWYEWAFSSSPVTGVTLDSGISNVGGEHFWISL